jgi:hypothetical protein
MRPHARYLWMASLVVTATAASCNGGAPAVTRTLAPEPQASPARGGSTATRPHVPKRDPQSVSWVQVAELVAADGTANDDFGGSIAVSGDTILIGASGKAAAYVYTLSNGTWTLQQEITSSTPSFGSSVALSGDTALIGAPDSSALEGAAYVYVRSGTTWTLQQELTGGAAFGGDSGNYPTSFGVAVALEGDVAMVGADGTGTYEGSVYVFANASGTWSLQQVLNAPDAMTNDGFGIDVAISGGRVVISDRIRALAYFFSQSGSTWSLQQELALPETPDGVALSEDTAMFGMEGIGAWDYAETDGGWTNQGQASLGITAGAVALSAGTAVVGVPRNIYLDAGIGSVVVYEAADGGWNEQQSMAPRDIVDEDLFGTAVAFSGGTIAAGAPGRRVGANANQGVVYVEVYGPAPGSACDAGSDCVLGYCADGVCCDSPCSSLCVACAASRQQSRPDGGASQDGVCGPANAGTNPHDDPCGPDPPSTCGHDGQCDGRGACQYYPSTTPCGGCTGDTLNSSACSGTGACVAGTATSCPGNLACAADGGTCKTTCVTGADCASDTVCSSGACVPKQGGSATCVAPSTSRSADGGQSDCAPYTCGPTGTCNLACESVHDCVDGNVCDPGNRCVQAPSNSTGASCSGAPLRPGGAPVSCFVAVAALIAAWRRRRACLKSHLRLPGRIGIDRAANGGDENGSIR